MEVGGWEFQEVASAYGISGLRWARDPQRQHGGPLAVIADIVHVLARCLQGSCIMSLLLWPMLFIPWLVSLLQHASS